MPRSLSVERMAVEQEDACHLDPNVNAGIQGNEEIIVDTEQDAVIVICTDGDLVEDEEEVPYEGDVLEEHCEPAMADHAYVAYPPWITMKFKNHVPVDTEVVSVPDINEICLSQQEPQIEDLSAVITCSSSDLNEGENAVDQEIESVISIPENEDTNSRKTRLRVSTRKRRALEGFITYPEKSTRVRPKRISKSRKPRQGKANADAVVQMFNSVEEAVERIHLGSEHAENEPDMLKEENEEYSLNNRHFIRWSRKGNKTIKQWECGKCSLVFDHQKHLEKHVASHSEKKYSCDICGKAFSQGSTLCRHKASHSDSREFLCQFCGKSFNRASTLISHKRIHSKEKSHICEICGKGFHQKGNLKNHLFTHTDERPYKCDKCDRGFNQMSNLMCHKAHAHINKPKFKCMLCDLEFSRKISLRAHELCVHNTNKKTGESSESADLTTKWGRPSNNARTITLPNGDKTINFNEGIKQELLQKVQEKKNKKMVQRDALKKDKVSPNFNGILIPRIDAEGVREAEESGQPVFASLKPSQGIPVLVKVVQAQNDMHVLIPATAEELRLAGKITVSNTGNQNASCSVKSVQVKVPVVATIIQKITEDGDMYLEIVPHTQQKNNSTAEEMEAVIESAMKISAISSEQMNTALS